MNDSPDLLTFWRSKLLALVSHNDNGDRAHDFSHLERVWGNAAQILSSTSGANHLVVMAACYLHDLVSMPKSHPDRANASRLSAERARVQLGTVDFPADHIDAVAHAIEAHSCSASVSPETYEAEIVQDADRLDALGAIGLARMFHVGGRFGRGLAHGSDPLGKERSLDDMRYTLDHIENKLLRLPATMKTPQGRQLAQARAEVIVQFRDQFVSEWMGTQRHSAIPFPTAMNKIRMSW